MRPCALAACTGAKLGEVGHQHDGPRIPSPLGPPTTLDAWCCERFVAVFAIPMFIKRLRLRLLIRRAEQDFLQVVCKRFSGSKRHGCQTDRAPMLVGTPLPVNLSVLVALG